MPTPSGGTAVAETVAAPSLTLTQTQRPATGAVAAPLLREWSRAGRAASRLLIGLPASTWLVIDATLMTAWLALGYSLVPLFEPEITPHIYLWQAAAVFSFSLMISSLVFGLYERETLMSRSRLFTRLLLATAAACLIAYGIIYVVMYSTISRRIVGVGLSSFLVSSLAVRLCAHWAIHKVHRGLLVVGSRGLFESFQRAQANGFLAEYRLVGYVTTDTAHPPPTPSLEGRGRPAESAAGDPNYRGSASAFVAHLTDWCVTDVVVGAEAAGDANVMEWVVPCLRHGCRVTNEAIFYEKATGQILVDEITPYWFLFADLKIHCDEHATLKRLIDLGTALLGLCLSAPLWPLIALLVKLNDGGPVFYSQDRVGQNGQIFRLYKFRTMHTNAENGQSIWASPDDPRVTRVGRLLRRARLDELPQLYNILVGEMSVVGPRPERTDIVLDLCRRLPYYAERHLVKPGLTGWAQISFRYGSSIADAKRKLQFDLYYLKHMSFELDAMIILRTVGTFLKGAC